MNIHGVTWACHVHDKWQSCLRLRSEQINVLSLLYTNTKAFDTVDHAWCPVDNTQRGWCPTTHHLVAEEAVWRNKRCHWSRQRSYSSVVLWKRFQTRLWSITATVYNLWREDHATGWNSTKNRGRCIVGGRAIWNLRYADDTTLLATSLEELQHQLSCRRSVFYSDWK